jgi:hypothetical protein
MAGYAVLVRQYFLDGFYPSGYANPSDSFSPSGALIKAILVNSAVELDAINDEERMVNTKKGDNNQGYGRIQLSNSLSFNVPATVDGLTMFIKGSSNMSSEHFVQFSAINEQHFYRFTAKADATADIRITLAYTDYFGTSTMPDFRSFSPYLSSLSSLLPSLPPSLSSSSLLPPNRDRGINQSTCE